MARRSLNKVQIIGNLGRDPEMRFTQSGMGVANFTVATTDSWQDRDGNTQERTEWHKVVAFGKLAEICNQYLHKGKQVYIEGRIQTRDWQDKDGNKRYTTEIVANEMMMLGTKGGGGSSSRGGQGDNDEPPPYDDDGDDDIPF